MTNGLKRCSSCKQELSYDHFYIDTSRSDGLTVQCKECLKKMERRRKGSLPLQDNITCRAYFGVIIAEPYLIKHFQQAIRMPYGNKGYDYLCSKGYKIDVKSSHESDNGWVFNIKLNTIANYFFCIGYGTKQSHQIKHVWLIPASIINQNVSFTIGFSERSIQKWNKYELAILE